MLIHEFGIRVDSLELLEDILNGSYRPENSADKAVYEEMNRWLECFEKLRIDYVYYGSEFCNKRFPAAQEWREMVSFCAEQNKVLVMVIPQADDETGEKVLNIISEFYSKYQLENFEILVNDFGILEKVNKIPYLKHNLTVRLGRVLDKTYHDGRLNDQEQMRLYRDCKVRWSDDGTWIPEMAKCVLRRYPVNGIDIDIPAIASMCSTKKDDPEYSVGMFVPYSYTTTGGICLMQNIGIPYERKFGSSNKSCQKKCLEYIQKMKKKVIDIHDENPGMNNGHNMKDIVMYRVGNTVYYIRNCNPEAIVTTGNIRRLIFEPKLMI